MKSTFCLSPFKVITFLLFLSAISFQAQDTKFNQGLYWTFEVSNVKGIGNVNYQGIPVDYSASTLSIGSSVGHALNAKSSLGVGVWINAFSQLRNDNLAFPFFIEYNYAFKEEAQTPMATIRLGNSFKFGEFSEVENGLHFNLRFSYKKLPVFRGQFSLSPFVGFVAQQIKDDFIFVVNPGGGSDVITDNVTFTALHVGLSFYVIK